LFNEFKCGKGMGEYNLQIEVTFLGNGDAFSSGGKMHTCTLINSTKRKFLIDCSAELG
jgi:hypothetical protein